MKKVSGILICLLLTIACYSQSNGDATNIEEAVENYNYFQAKEDTTNIRQDSLMLMYEKRIEDMKNKFQAKEAIKPE